MMCPVPTVGTGCRDGETGKKCRNPSLFLILKFYRRSKLKGLNKNSNLP